MTLPVSMGEKVLVLNQNYEPLSLCNVRKAVVLLLLGKAEMVEARKDSALRTVSSVYPYPSIVRLFAYVRLPFRKVELTRKNILRRDSHRCGYCGTAYRPRYPEVAWWRGYLGEPCGCMRQVQQSQGEPDSGGGRDGPHPQAVPSKPRHLPPKVCWSR